MLLAYLDTDQVQGTHAAMGMPGLFTTWQLHADHGCLWMAGDGAFGQLGAGRAITHAPQPVQLQGTLASYQVCSLLLPCVQTSAPEFLTFQQLQAGLR